MSLRHKCFPKLCSNFVQTPIYDLMQQTKKYSMIWSQKQKPINLQITLVVKSLDKMILKTKYKKLALILLNTVTLDLYKRNLNNFSKEKFGLAKNTFSKHF